MHRDTTLAVEFLYAHFFAELFSSPNRKHEEQNHHWSCCHAVVLEEVAKMTFLTSMQHPELPMNPDLIDKHFNRKHGPDAYYGQEVAVEKQFH